jgi:hypothetical protein
MNVELAVAFVEAHGDPAQKALASYAVGRTSLDEAITAISLHQRADGSWSGIDPDMPAAVSSISQTWLGLQWLIWLRPAGADLLDQTVAFLRSVQHPGGNWDEPDEIVSHSPPPWMIPGNHDNQVWLTSAVMCKLKELGRDGDVRSHQALHFLRGAWQRDRRQFNDGTHSHWMALPLFFGSTHELDREIIAGCRARLVYAAENHVFDPYDYHSAAYAALLTDDTALFTLCMNKLEGFQQPDGGMTTNYGDHHRPNGTLEMLFLLKRANML